MKNAAFWTMIGGGIVALAVGDSLMGTMYGLFGGN